MRFFKMHGCGNDFILVDNMDLHIQHADKSHFAENLCRRKFGIGADGLIFIEPPDGNKADFKWKFYNADGSEAEMCGNGGRCAALFAWNRGIAGSTLSFETLAGIIHAEITGENSVKLELTKPEGLVRDVRINIGGKDVTLDCINTGVPHACCMVDNLKEIDVSGTGRAIRHHDAFSPDGTNVNFVNVRNMHEIAIRTYERGVEDETLACGTGAVASAILTALAGLVQSPVDVMVKGKDVLKIYFSIDETDNHKIDNVFMEGPAITVFSGETL